MRNRRTKSKNNTKYSESNRKTIKKQILHCYLKLKTLNNDFWLLEHWCTSTVKTIAKTGLWRLGLPCFIMLSLVEMDYSLCTKTKSPSMHRTAYWVITKPIIQDIMPTLKVNKQYNLMHQSHAYLKLRVVIHQNCNNSYVRHKPKQGKLLIMVEHHI